MRMISCVLSMVGLLACGGRPASTTTALATPAPVTGQQPAAPGVGRVDGVTYRVPSGWTVVNEGHFSIAKNEHGDMGLVMAGWSTSEELDAAEKRARDVFHAAFPFEAKTARVQFSNFPTPFVMAADFRPKGDNDESVFVFGTHGVKTDGLTIYVYAVLPHSKWNEPQLSNELADVLDSVTPAATIETSGEHDAR